MPDANPSFAGNVRQVYRRGSRPIRVEPAKLNMPVEIGPWPMTRLPRQSVFDGIDVNIVAVAKPVGFIAYAVFPERRRAKPDLPGCRTDATSCIMAGESGTLTDGLIE